MKIRIVGYCLALALAISTVALALQTGEPAPSFDLKDQFGKLWKLADLKNNIVVIVAANQKSGRAMGPWVDNLKTKYEGKIRILGLLDLHDIFVLGRGIAKSRIRSETKDPMMLDFNGDTGKAYQVSDKYPVVMVIDKKGIVRDVEKANYTQNAFKSAASAIESALQAR
jgi:predicted transcriptional regulator